MTRHGRRVLSLAGALPRTSASALVGAILLASGTAQAAPAAPVKIPADARVENTPRATPGDGLCTQFAAAAATGSVNNSTKAIALIDQTMGAPAQADPQGVNNGITSFFGVSYLLDYYDENAGAAQSGGFGYDLLFPWSKASTGEICQSHQPNMPVVRDAFSARYSGYINIRTAGTKTFAIESDDGYQLKIGGVTVSEYQNNRSAAMDSRRATFAEAGVYPFQLIYWEQGGVAMLELAMSEKELIFTGNDRTKPVALGTANSDDLNNAGAGVIPATAGFGVLGDANADQSILFLADADKVAMRCGPSVGEPSDICTLNDVKKLCGNAVIDQRADKTVEQCDDGNAVDGDGCSKVCDLEPGYLCVGVPSKCSLDLDGDGLTNDLEKTLGTDPTKADSDGDGIDDKTETDNGKKVDTDGDGTIDALDLDSDNDGIPDAIEGTTDSDGDGKGDWRDDDDDNDGILTKDEIALATAAKLSDDVDGDGKKNWLDTDADGDGVPDGTDGVGDNDGDGKPNFLDPLTEDQDGDGLTDVVEGGGDTDGDGIPDYLDPDDDNDGILTKDEVQATITSKQSDDVDGDGKKNWLDTDADGDGLDDNDPAEGLGDTDGDGIPNFLDNNKQDSDGDSLTDDVEGSGDTDGDGIPDYLDPDDDNDGILTKDEISDATTAGVSSDVDGDGKKNWLDTDADGDGKSDTDEGRGDSDKDGIPNYLDPTDDMGQGGAGAGGSGGQGGDTQGGAGGDTAGGAGGDQGGAGTGGDTQGGAGGDTAGGAGGTTGGAAGTTTGGAGGSTSQGGAGAGGGQTGGQAGAAGKGGSGGTGGASGQGGKGGSGGTAGSAGTGAAGAGAAGAAGKGTAGAGAAGAAAGKGGSAGAGNTNSAGGSTPNGAAGTADETLGAGLELEGNGCSTNGRPSTPGGSAALLMLGAIGAWLRRRR